MATENYERRKPSPLVVVTVVFILLLTLVNFVAVLYLSIALGQVKEQLVLLQSEGLGIHELDSTSSRNIQAQGDGKSRRIRETSDGNASTDLSSFSMRVFNEALQAAVRECFVDGPSSGDTATSPEKKKKENKRRRVVHNVRNVHIVSSRHIIGESILQPADQENLLAYKEVNVTGGAYHRINGFKPDDGGAIRGLWEVDEPHSSQEHIGVNKLFDDSVLSSSGILRVNHAGVYLIYFKVIFQTSALHQSIGLKNGESSLSSCIVSERFTRRDLNSTQSGPTNVHNMSVFLPCDSTIVVHLEARSSLSLSNLYPNRWILPSKDLTYWGVTKL